MSSLCDNVVWLGAVDWNIRDFHSYDTHRGATYNAYLVRDERTALIDTVKQPFAELFLRNLAAAVPLERLDYVVCNHAEPDHSGALPAVMAAAPRAMLLCNKRCAAALAQHYDTASWKIQQVTSGEELSLGRQTLRFIDTPMVHWPESMFTYLVEERLLFSMDAFGQHYASSQRFDDEVPLGAVMEEAKTYYANIIMPYNKQVACCLDHVTPDVRMIAPSHGIIWRSHLSEIMARYRQWAGGQVRPKVLVLYDSMWESTTAMAEAILEGANQQGVEALLMHARRTSLTRMASEALDTAAFAVGSSTLNREMMPAMAGAMCYLKGLRPEGRAGLAFGSYGWGRGGPDGLQELIEKLPWEIVRPVLRTQFRPTPELLAECRAAGELLAEKAKSLAVK